MLFYDATLSISYAAADVYADAGHERYIFRHATLLRAARENIDKIPR